MPNRRRRKLSTAMSAVAALAVVSPIAITAITDLTKPAPQPREFRQAAMITDLPNELMSALSQGLSQFGINLPPMPTSMLTGSDAGMPTTLTAPGGLGAAPLTAPAAWAPLPPPRAPHPRPGHRSADRNRHRPCGRRSGARFGCAGQSRADRHASGGQPGADQSDRSHSRRPDDAAGNGCRPGAGHHADRQRRWPARARRGADHVKLGAHRARPARSRSGHLPDHRRRFPRGVLTGSRAGEHRLWWTSRRPQQRVPDIGWRPGDRPAQGCGDADDHVGDEARRHPGRPATRTTGARRPAGRIVLPLNGTAEAKWRALRCRCRTLVSTSAVSKHW